jgi:hypothetical protein
MALFDGRLIKSKGMCFDWQPLVTSTLCNINRRRRSRLWARTKADGASYQQRETMAAMERAGATVAHAIGIEEALRQLEDWGLLRGRAS